MWYAVIAALAVSLIPMLVRICIAFGVGIIVYVGFTSASGYLHAHINSAYSSIPSAALNLLFMAGLDKGINIIISAYVISVTNKGLARTMLKAA